MQKKSLCRIILILFLIVAISPESTFAIDKVIFDTDIGPDWDDVGAVATLHALVNSGEAEILGMMVSSGGHSATWGPPCLDAFNTYYGRPDIPIGVAADGPGFGSSYNQQIAREFEQDLGTDNAWNAVELYRKLLSEQEDSSVVIITTGFMTNIADLLMSEADEYSSLNGIDLVKQKVKKWACMGGGYPQSGGEFNFNQDAASTKYAVENWPVPVLFSGFEIGSPLQTGAKLAFTSEDNPIRRAYELAGGYVGCTRSSWDQTAVLAAVREPLLYWNLETTGYCHVFDNGSNEWYSSPDKDHSYLVKKVSNDTLVEIIDNLMANIHGLPSVELTSPAYNSSFAEGANISITANATDPDGHVAKVEFFARNNKIGEDESTPFSMVWTDVAKGGYYLSATVIDGDGNKMLSSPVKIFVGDVDRNLVGHWMFEENAADSSDYGNSGIITGNPEFVQGNSGEGAIKFNDANDFVVIPESPDFSMTGFTLAARVKIPNSIPSGWRTIVEHNRWGRNWFGLWKSANGNRFHFRWGNAGNSTADFNSTISSDQWYHVAATFNSDQKTAKLYLNGNLDKVINNADAPASLLAELRIGINMDGNEVFQGIIDDLRIYNVPLETSDIENLIAATGVKYKHSDTEIPEKYSLSNYPNPFNPSTTIQYYLPANSHVMITIRNVNGRVIETLVNQRMQAGHHSCQFHGENYASGIYFYQLIAGEFKISKKMLYLK